MRIAISQRIVENQSYVEFRDALAHDWATWVEKIFPQAALIAIPNHPGSIKDWWLAASPDLLILSGGNNWAEFRDRDDTESLAVSLARKSSIPIVGVCRGLQGLNMMLGGSIQNDITSFSTERHVAADHRVSIFEKAFLDIAKTETLTVNSFHDQGVLLTDLAPELKAFALADGDIVEGLFHMEEPILAVQWHPERLIRSQGFDMSIIRNLYNCGAFWKKGQE
jgi:N5-(cytidine 5'-diphosphoramidyl)-L-glutamine hydrolase